MVLWNIDDKARLERENEQLKKDIKKQSRISAIKNIFERSNEKSQSFEDNDAFVQEDSDMSSSFSKE